MITNDIKKMLLRYEMIKTEIQQYLSKGHSYPSDNEVQKFVEVNADTLGNILQNIKVNHHTVNWIKIDVEGAELEVLKGAQNILSKSKEISLLIEVHVLAQGKNLYEPIINLLKNYGFTIKYEKSYEDREKHVILHKNTNTVKV